MDNNRRHDPNGNNTSSDKCHNLSIHVLWTCQQGFSLPSLQRHAELGPSLLHQATSRGLPIIAAYFLDKRTDATACLPARHDPDRSTSTLLLLLDASEVCIGLPCKHESCVCWFSSFTPQLSPSVMGTKNCGANLCVLCPCALSKVHHHNAWMKE